MAEIGLIASGISIASLAIQIGDSIIKLKDFCSLVKDAPEEIEYLIEELEVLGLVISDIEASITSNQDESTLALDATTVSRCLGLCKRGADALEKAVQELGAELEKGRKRGSFKTALRKGTTDRLREKLRNAQSLMVLSQQTYYHALQTVQHNRQKQWAEQHRQEVSKLNEALRQKSDEHADSHHELSDLPNKYVNGNLRPVTRITRSKIFKRQKLFTAKLQTPRWLPITYRAWKFCGYIHHSSVSFSLRIYVDVAPDAEVLKYVRLGDILRLQTLLQEGKASLHSRNIWLRLTLLDEAALCYQTKMCQFLLDQGLDPNDSCCGSSFRVLYTSPRPMGLCDAQDEELTHMALKLLLMTDDDDLSYMISNYRMGSLTTLLAVLRYAGLEARSEEEKMALIMNIHPSTPSKYYVKLVQYLLPKKISITAANYCQFIPRGDTFLHVICRHIGDKFPLDAQQYKSKAGSLSKEFVEMPALQSWVSAFLAAGADVYAASGTWQRTPMLVLFESIWDNIYFEKRELKTFQRGLTLWLQLLHGAGLDLEVYGETSRRIHNGRGANKSLEVTAKLPLALEWSSYRYRFLGCDFGPKPEDWVFYGTEEPDESASDFWDMVEHPERAIPGAWIAYD